MTERVPRRVARPVGPRDHLGMGRHAHAAGALGARRRLRQASSRAGMAYGHRAVGHAGRDAGPDLERIRLLRARDRRPGGGTGRDVGAPDRGSAGGDHDDRCVLARAGRARGPRRYAWVAARPVETMPAAELADTWDEVWARIGRCWSIHFYAIRGPYQVLEDLADLYESVIEAPAPGEALGLIGGGDHELQAVERGLEELAAIVAADAGPRRAPGRARTSPSRTLAALPGARPSSRRALSAFLAEHGHLGQNVDDLTLASWAEEPGLVLAELAKRVRNPGRRSAPRNGGAAGRRGGRARRCGRGRPSPATRRSSREFEELLADARAIGHLTETHNYWIDRMAQASLRRFVVRVGRRLADAGSIATASGHLPPPSRRGPRPPAPR